MKGKGIIRSISGTTGKPLYAFSGSFEQLKKTSPIDVVRIFRLETSTGNKHAFWQGLRNQTRMEEFARTRGRKILGERNVTAYNQELARIRNSPPGALYKLLDDARFYWKAFSFKKQLLRLGKTLKEGDASRVFLETPAGRFFFSVRKIKSQIKISPAPLIMNSPGRATNSNNPYEGLMLILEKGFQSSFSSNAFAGMNPMQVERVSGSGNPFIEGDGYEISFAVPDMANVKGFPEHGEALVKEAGAKDIGSISIMLNPQEQSPAKLKGKALFYSEQIGKKYGIPLKFFWRGERFLASAH